MRYSRSPSNRALAQVEAIILAPDSTHGDYVLANSIAEAINTIDKNNPEWEDEPAEEPSPETGNVGNGNANSKKDKK